MGSAPYFKPNFWGLCFWAWAWFTPALCFKFWVLLVWFCVWKIMTLFWRIGPFTFWGSYISLYCIGSISSEFLLRTNVSPYPDVTFSDDPETLLLIKRFGFYFTVILNSFFNWLSCAFGIVSASFVSYKATPYII